jgi:monofunctional biosynthetic peptidoglycan transglycosylase
MGSSRFIMAKRKAFKPLFLLFTLLAVLFAYLLLMPDISSLKKKTPTKTAFMKYREKEWAKKGRRYKVTQTVVPLARISPYLRKAVLIAEDDKFWKHEGFDFASMQKALEKDLQAGKFKFGGSTISQQLARTLYLSPEKNLLRKGAEAVITWRMEKVLSKRRILELYLNEVEWGEGIFGAEAAARHYFGKSAYELSPREAARMAAVLPNPRKYNPAGEQRYVLNRSRIIYDIMLKRGIVAPEYEEETGSSQPDANAETNALRENLLLVG